MQFHDDTVFPTAVPDGLVAAPDGTYYGTARTAYEAGHEARVSTVTPWRHPGDMATGTIVQSRPKQSTVTVPWHLAKGRIAVGGVLITQVGDDVDGPWYSVHGDAAGEVTYAKSGLIEVLIEEDQ